MKVQMVFNPRLLLAGCKRPVSVRHCLVAVNVELRRCHSVCIISAAQNKILRNKVVHMRMRHEERLHSGQIKMIPQRMQISIPRKINQQIVIDEGL